MAILFLLGVKLYLTTGPEAIIQTILAQTVDMTNSFITTFLIGLFLQIAKVE